MDIYTVIAFVSGMVLGCVFTWLFAIAVIRSDMDDK